MPLVACLLVLFVKAFGSILGFMSLFSDSAVVLRRLDYSETSQVLVLLTRRHGKVRCIAKGVKRSTRARFAAAIDLLELGDVVWSARPDRPQNLAILTEWKQRRGFSTLREKLTRLYAAQYAAEITSALMEDHDPHEQLFLALVECLEAISQKDEPLPELCRFQRKLLDEIGLMPRTDACTNCGRGLPSDASGQAWFSSHQGGPLCRDCETAHVEKRRVDLSVLRAVQEDAISQTAAGPVFDLLNYHISHLMRAEPHLARFVRPTATHVATGRSKS